MDVDLKLEKLEIQNERVKKTDGPAAFLYIIFIKIWILIKKLRMTL